MTAPESVPDEVLTPDPDGRSGLTAISSRRLRVGRLAFYIEPRDAWVGVYVAPDAVYLCPLPFLVARWTR